jgi:peptidoglycan/xylan/chitin deacetylase (PgdA/CDA1 family)
MQAEPASAPAPKVIEEPAVHLPQSRSGDAKTPDSAQPAPRTDVAPPAPKPMPRRVAPAVAPKAVIPADAPTKRAVTISTAEFSRNPGANGEVALSFDSCYDDKPLGDILAALDHHGYHATFFVAGIFADRYPASVRRIAGAGMELGNHSWSHPAFTKLSNAEIDRQLTRTNDLIEKLTGERPTLFRPPFGARDNRVRRAVAEDGFHTVYWALDSWDSVKKGITAKEITDRVLSRVHPGDVVLLHVGSQATADALPAILAGLDARGLRVVPVSRLMS